MVNPCGTEVRGAIASEGTSQLTDGKARAKLLARANEAKDAAKKGAKGAVGVCGSPHYGSIELLA
jgi:hypothetical protein